MLKIILYKNCILNETYQNVFSVGQHESQSNETTLQKYLDTLVKSQEIIVNDAYYENNDELVFDYFILITGGMSTDIYSFNYMRINEYNDETNNLILTRYCFINSIRVKNGCVYLNYKEDIWSSYSGKIAGITESFLSRSRVKNYGTNGLVPSLISLPFDYDGNNKLSFESILGNNRTFSGSKCRVVFQIQIYNTVQQGQQEYREVFYLASLSPIYYYQVQDEIRNLGYFQSTGYCHRYYYSGSEYKTTNQRYEIGDIFVIPEEFDISSLMPNTNFVYRFNEYEMTSPEQYSTFAPSRVLSITEKTIFKTGSILNNYKNLAIGTFNHKIDLVNNGTTVDYEMFCVVSVNDFSLFISANNTIIDISNDFVYELPFSFTTSSELSQRLMARNLKNINLKYGIAQNSLEMGRSTMNFGTDIASDLIPGMSLTSKQKRKKSGKGIIASGIVNSISDTIDYGFDIAENALNIAKLNEESAQINAPIFTASIGTFECASTFINSFYGLILFKMDSDNDTFVKSFINNFGYKVYEFINDISKLKLNNSIYFIANLINYNVVKFETINVYGSFTREIALQLNEILANGVKIWYNYQMIDDNYVV